MGRIRYQAPSQLHRPRLWGPWPPPPEPMERAESCRWLCEHYEEFKPELEEARERLREVKDEIKPIRKEKWKICDLAPNSHECSSLNQELKPLFKERDELEETIDKRRFWLENLRERMGELKCEEIGIIAR